MLSSATLIPRHTSELLGCSPACRSRVGFAGDAILDHLQRAGKFLAVHPQCVQEHLEAFPLALFAQGAGATAPFPPMRILCDPQSA